MLEEQQPNLVTVWSHDLTVKPGKTYRYRVSVSLINPLFQRLILSPEQKEDEFHKLSLVSKPSAWSEPITVAPERHFFLVADSQQKQSVDVEVFTIFNGAWRSHRFNVRPGDTIGSEVTLSAGDVEAEIDLSLGYAVVDLDFDASYNLGQRLERKTTEMLFMDLATGKLNRRTVAGDQKHKDLIRLRLDQKLDGLQQQQQQQARAE